MNWRILPVVVCDFAANAVPATLHAILAHCQGARVFYSRDHTFYAAVRAGTPPWFSRRAIVAAIDQLVACGLIKEWRTSPSAGARYRSRLAATQKLIEAIGLDNVSAIL